MKHQASSRHKVLFIDDDPFGTRRYVEALSDANFEVVPVTTVEAALSHAENGGYSVAVVDVMMPPGPAFDPVETAGGFRTGVALARRLRAINSDIAILGISTMPDTISEQWFRSQSRMSFAPKVAVRPESFVQRVTQLVGLGNRMLRAFIVHGRDRGTVLELKDFLQNRLGLPEPIILDQQASSGRTVIEKFEFFADQIDVAFVLLTPDDVGQLSGANSLQHRARQNDIFELGFFVARLGRVNGPVIVLVRGSVELPSDIKGLVYIDISNGVESAGEQIRRELGCL